LAVFVFHGALRAEGFFLYSSESTFYWIQQLLVAYRGQLEFGKEKKERKIYRNVQARPLVHVSLVSERERLLVKRSHNDAGNLNVARGQALKHDV
jgi:hypothetical protein